MKPTTNLQSKLITFFIGILLSNLLQAQTFTEQTSITLTGVSGHSDAWGDYNNDGYLDLVLAGNDGTSSIVKLYLNNGDGTFTWQTAVTFAVNTVYDVAWGDYDNDGDLDLLIASTFNSKLYENKGDGTFALKVNLPEVFSGKCLWADLNNDGFQDIVLTGSDGTKLLKNNQDGTFTAQPNTIPTVSNYSAVACGDYDNDGDPDILIAGYSSTEITKVFRNNGNFTFTEQAGIVLPGISNCAVAWADIDNDGDLDIILSGAAYDFTTKIYENKGSNTFTLLAGTPFQDLYRSSMDIADYDNDGYKDIIIAGSYDGSDYYTNVYHNNGNKTFTKVTAETVPGVQFGTVKFGDYDNDGKLDLFICGNASTGKIAKIYKNGTATANTAATAPSNLLTSVSGNNVTFTWSKAADTQTSQNGLSYNLYVYKVGATDFKCSPQAFRQTDTKNGQRLVAQMGSLQYRTAGYILLGIPDGTYKWSIQAVDAGLKGGSFATEAILVIDNSISLAGVGINVANSQITGTNTLMQYSINSTDGTDGTWTACTTINTSVNFNTGGFDVWVRQTAIPTNKRKVASIALQAAAPAFTIDYINETSNEIATVATEYSVYSNFASSSSVVNDKIIIKPSSMSSITYIRTKATSTNVASAVQSLATPARPYGTQYSVNYNLGVTNEPIATTDEYSTNADMSNASFGTGVPISLTTGQNVYFRTPANSTTFKSSIRTLTVLMFIFREQTNVALPGISQGSVAWGDYNNDGYQDFILTGSVGVNNLISKIFKNNGDGTFSEQTGIVLPGVQYSSVAWGDYNNDGWLDILLSGSSSSGEISKIYKNNGDGTFTEQTGIVLTGVSTSSVAWGDYNNDGWLDILLTGAGNGYLSKLYKNNGDNTFTEQTGISLTGVGWGSAAWGDYNNDGRLDIILSGENSSTRLTKIYKNNGNNTFTEQTGISLPGTSNSSVAWGDYNNDGYLDILLSGDISSSNYVCKIFKNNGDGTFSDISSSMFSNDFGTVVWGDYNNDGYLDVISTGRVGTFLYKNNGDDTFSQQAVSLPQATWTTGSSVAFADYDNDGKLDVLIAGYDNKKSNASLAKLFRNIGTYNSNTLPLVPANLQQTTAGDSISLKWDRATDAETPQNGLSYNIYVYKEGDSNFFKTPQAFLVNDTKNGQRLIPQLGSIQYSANGYTLKNLPMGNYKWSVHAIDQGFQGGAFAPESSFKIVLGSEIQVNVINKQIINTTTDIEYSIDSNNGTNGTWATCSAPNTSVNFGLGGFDVWVREKGTTASQKLATIDYRPDAPTSPSENDSINEFNWVFNPAFSGISDYEYSKDNGVTWTSCSSKPINVGDLNIPIGHVQVRVKATSSRVEGDVLKSGKAFTIRSTVGISSLSDAGITIFPNPVFNALTIKGLKELSTISISDMNGRIVKILALQNNTEKVNVDDLPSGVYVLTIECAGKIIGQSKFIKQ